MSAVVMMVIVVEILVSASMTPVNAVIPLTTVAVTRVTNVSSANRGMYAWSALSMLIVRIQTHHNASRAYAAPAMRLMMRVVLETASAFQPTASSAVSNVVTTMTVPIRQLLPVPMVRASAATSRPAMGAMLPSLSV